MKHGCEFFPYKTPTTSSAPPRDRPVQVDGENLTLGYAWVYSSFLSQDETAARTYGLDTLNVLLAVGRRAFVGRQQALGGVR